MFPGAQTKLEDVRLILEQLKATSDAPSFRALFNSFLNAARAITNALQKDGGHVIGFAEWYGAKQVEMRNDELLRFIHTARTEDFHEGKHALEFMTYVEQLISEPSPFPDAEWVVGPEGAFWIVEKGTPQERRIPIKPSRGYTTYARIANAPKTHMGITLERDDPAFICELTANYLSNLLHEAKLKFDPGLAATS